ncbi:MAG: helix-turn-helix domain-containing protein [Pseudonocardiaceae bacterium]
MSPSSVKGLAEDCREGQGRVDEEKAFGARLREVRSWRGLTLREAAGFAGLSFSFWGQVERGEKAVNSRRTLEAMAAVLRVHPTELSGQPWMTPRDAVSSEAHAGLLTIETALERYGLGTDPELLVRAWPQIQADLDRLVELQYNADYTAQGELAPALIGELHGAYARLPQRHREVLIGLMMAYGSAMFTSKRLGGRGLPALAARAVRQCAEALGEVVWLGYATYLRGHATGHLDRAGQYRRSVAAAETLTGELDCGDALQACGMLHLSAALAAGAQGDRATVATHLEEASALAARMDTEVGDWGQMSFGRINVGIWRTSLAVELGEYGQAIEAAKTVHPELLPVPVVRQAMFWVEFGRALVAERKTWEEGLRVLLRAERLAPQRVRNDLFVREAVANLLRQARRDAGGRELRGLAWRMGVAPTR